MKPPSSGGEVLNLEKWPPSSLMSLILAVPAAVAPVLENSTLFLASDQNQYFIEKRRRAKELNKSSDKHNKYWKDEILQAERSRKHSRYSGQGSHQFLCAERAILGLIRR